MNSFVVYEALAVGFKEAFKIGIVWLVFYSYLVLNNKKPLIKPFYWGLFFVFLISVITFLLPQGVIPRERLSNFIATSFALIFLSSGAALFNAAGTNLFGGSDKINFVLGRLPAGIIIFLLTLLFFSPDSIGSVLFLKDLAVMKAAEPATYASALAGFLLVAIAFFIIIKFSRPYRIGNFFDLPQLLLFLSAVKLLGGGIKGLEELSLIPSVQRGFMKFSHDFIHQTFVLLMVPDHPLLKTTVWNFIGLFFGSNVASIASLFILLLFPFLFIYHSLFKPMPEPEAQTGAQRRKIRYLLLSEKRRKGLPVIFFIGIILALWFSQTGESVSRIYKPIPKPVVEDKGVVLIPINDPTMDLMDGALHKFSLMHGGEEIRILIIKKSNNTISVCLDACEICSPEGYGQREDHVVCIYCNTPIPVDTLGQPGGCNPIPLSAIVDERFVRIDVSEILKKWEYVKTGKSKEAIK